MLFAATTSFPRLSGFYNTNLSSHGSEGQNSTIKGSGELNSFWRLLGNICFPVFSASRSCLHSLTFSPSHIFSNPQVLMPPSHKDPCDYTGPIRKIHSNLFIPRYGLNHIYKVPFTRLGNMFISPGDYDMDDCKVSAIIVLTTEGSKQKKKEKR